MIWVQVINNQTIGEFPDFDNELKKKKWKKKHGFIDEVQLALLKEIDVFNRREDMIAAFRVLLWIHFLAIFLSLTTYYLYSAVWTGAIVLFGFRYCPTYSRLGGYVGECPYSILRPELALLTWKLAKNRHWVHNIFPKTTRKTFEKNKVELMQKIPSFGRKWVFTLDSVLPIHNRYHNVKQWVLSWYLQHWNGA